MNNVHASSGPVSSLPGSSHRFPAGSVCDRHVKQPAVARLQGETDSFGAEYFLACQDCVDRFRSYREQQLDTEKYCDWCNSMKKRVVKHRDMDEGTSGRVYNVCGDCRSKEAQRAAEELEDSGAWDSDDGENVDLVNDDGDYSEFED